MSFRFSKQQREELLKAVADQVSLLNNHHRTSSDYAPKPFLFELDDTHRNAFIALLDQDVDLLLAALDSERRRKKGRGAPRKEYLRQFVRQVAGHIEDALGIKAAVTHSPRSKGGLLAKVVQISLQAAGQKTPADPFRLLASAIVRRRETQSQAESSASAWQKGASYFPCDDQLHRHRTVEAAERCRQRGVSKKRKFKVEMDLRTRKTKHKRRQARLSHT